MGYLVGIDLGGTKIHTALAAKSGEILEERVLPTLAEEGEVAVLQRIIRSVQEVVLPRGISREEILAIGVGAPGLIDQREGIIRTAANLPFEEFPLAKAIQKVFPVPVKVENDGNAALLGEYHLGERKFTKNLVYITVSTGVGGAAMVDGKLLLGAGGGAFEIGHMPLVPDSNVLCGCGQYGHVESYVSGTGIRKAMERALVSGENSSLSLETPFGTREIHQAALSGDALSKSILEDAFSYLGMTISQVLTLLNPEVVILGGGVSSIGDMFLEKVKSTAEQYTLPLLYNAAEIRLSSFKERTGVVGAVAVALEEVQKRASAK
jgi:glucokinase